MIIYFIVFGVMLLSFIIQKVLTSRFEKYSKVGISLSGAEISV